MKFCSLHGCVKYLALFVCARKAITFVRKQKPISINRNLCKAVAPAGLHDAGQKKKIKNKSVTADSSNFWIVWRRPADGHYVCRPRWGWSGPFLRAFFLRDGRHSSAEPNAANFVRFMTDNKLRILYWDCGKWRSQDRCTEMDTSVLSR